MLASKGRVPMELWLAAFVIIVAMVAVGTVVARTWRPQGPHHGLGPVLAARLVAVVIVTALAAAVARPGQRQRRVLAIGAVRA